MVTKEIIMETIKRMLASEIDEATIKATLADIGVSESEAEQYIAEAKSAKPAESPTPEPFHEVVAARTAEKVKDHLDALRHETELRETSVHTALEAHNAKLEEVHSDIKGLHEKISNVATPQPVDFMPLNNRLTAIESDIADIKAAMNAQQSLLKKILDTNRELLSELQKKK